MLFGQAYSLVKGNMSKMSLRRGYFREVIGHGINHSYFQAQKKPRSDSA